MKNSVIALTHNEALVELNKRNKVCYMLNSTYHEIRKFSRGIYELTTMTDKSKEFNKKKLPLQSIINTLSDVSKETKILLVSKEKEPSGLEHLTL